MPTVISHLAVPLALGIGAGRKTVSLPLLVCGAVGSVLPDFDVIGFRYGIAYANSFGHRGASHSFAAAILFGALVAIIAPLLRCKRSIAFAFAALCYASHPLLDMCTDAGLGVALLWPFSNKRYFAPWRPIDASPLSVERVLSERGWEILQTELVYVWLPMAMLCAMLIALRRVVVRA
jgi:inner membrane protein